jgi:hypothetical protein
MDDPTLARAHLVKALVADLVGPFRRGLAKVDGTASDGMDAVEELELPPSRWYLTGYLAPVEGRLPEEDEGPEELGAGDDESDEEAGAAEQEPKRRNFLPASMGLSVLVPAGVTKLRATVRYADYQRVDEEPPRREKKRKVWKRVPMPAASETLDLASGELMGDGVAVPDGRGLRLVGQVQPVTGVRGLPAGTRAVNVFLVNRRAPETQKGYADEAYVFQAELELECPEGFIARPDTSDLESDDPDELILDLQYRRSCEYAVGHGVSAEVTLGNGPVTRVRTTWVPTYEVRRVIARDVEGVTVSMDQLAELRSAEDVEQHLGKLPELYGAWIAEKRVLSLDGDEPHAKLDSKAREGTREVLLDRAEQARARIRDGLELLASQADVREAFCLANRAMALAARQRRPDAYKADQSPEWRLFQLAFVLLNLRGIAEPEHADRERAELIFFPTGGGKTEAYLGVIAVTLVLRRLRSQRDAHAGLGVAVLLRYTLRLLTLDQLGRAATLVCALESLRRKTPARLGAERFAVGLWVGRSATSNTMEQVALEVTRFKAGSGQNPCPVTTCPWCLTELGPSSLSLLASGKATQKSPDEVRVACPNDQCEFAARNHPEGIPVLFVDEQVYRELPCFVIGTVDKFAMLPWRGEAGKLFGKVTGRAGRLFYNPVDGKLPQGATKLPHGALPPDLIVQDELHLISGPLGTLVGLYETAVDYLCTRQGEAGPVRPKVIAATATVRRASQQIQALYARKQGVCVFPPPGVDTMDTYFSLVDPDPTHSGRLYVGVAAQGKGLKAILLRTYRTLIAAATRSYVPAGSPKQPADAYMTLVGYFNSLRELGGMRRIVDDELRVRTAEAERFRPLDASGPHPWFKNRVLDREPLELTSRESTGKVKTTKDRLGKPFAEKEHVDVLLSSNMISVGVDIDRLGLMVVAGQPKTSSEYIQATSRVGRQLTWPGLVVTCMNVHKPRDRSHYERFAAYHQSFYRYVEASSVTPFSGPALDRGLAGTLVAMVRFSHPELTPATGALEVTKYRELVERAIKALAERGGGQPDQDRATEEELKLQLEKRGQNLLETWLSLVQSTEAAAAKRRYSRFDKEKTGGPPLLFTPLDKDAPSPGTPESRFRAPTSMRDVEETAHLWLKTKLGPYEPAGKKGGA